MDTQCHECQLSIYIPTKDVWLLTVYSRSVVVQQWRGPIWQCSPAETVAATTALENSMINRVYMISCGLNYIDDT